MLARLIGLVLLALSLVELALFIFLGWWFGFGWVLLASLLTTLLGMLILRGASLSSYRRVRAQIQQGYFPGETVLAGLLHLVAGLLLLVPGFLTDLVGLLFLLPPVRILVILWLQRWIQRRFPHGP